ncbi:MAG: sigma-70 family RNA polymerase sigma factor, partial [Bacteroidetes bacterium]|nr:sigma-70 family RNA polymerase sigma factor [Bacteroidota bacterium]
KRRLQTTSLDKGLDDEDDENGQSIGSNIIDDSLDPEEELVREQRNKIMAEVIETMDEKYKDLINLYYFQELKYEEIAKLLDLPLGTVKVRLKRAKDFLARLLKGYDENY